MRRVGSSKAAMELFSEHGYEQTTVAEIAARAGLTERTFFRHYADKREVLFGGGRLFRENFVGALAAAPTSLPPLQAVTLAMQAAGATLEEYRGRRLRQSPPADHPGTQNCASAS